LFGDHSGNRRLAALTRAQQGGNWVDGKCALDPVDNSRSWYHAIIISLKILMSSQDFQGLSDEKPAQSAQFIANSRGHSGAELCCIGDNCGGAYLAGSHLSEPCAAQPMIFSRSGEAHRLVHRRLTR
jgi:hypothetical protein